MRRHGSDIIVAGADAPLTQFKNFINSNVGWSQSRERDGVLAWVIIIRDDRTRKREGDGEACEREGFGVEGFEGCLSVSDVVVCYVKDEVLFEESDVTERVKECGEVVVL
jgi:hypothetical protein